MHTNRDKINYGALFNEAIRGVVREALKCIDGNYMPGSHAFYITFITDVRGVKISDRLKQKFPDDLTIVLENEFWDLFVEEDRFSVSLNFDKEERLSIPYNSILRFADPSADFELLFTPTEDKQAEAGLIHHIKNSKDSIMVEQQDNVISIAELKKRLE